MNFRRLASGALALSVLGSMAAPALAQDAPPPPRPPGAYAQGGGQYYDPCHRETVNRGIGGAVVGGVAGAVIGSQVAASGHRSDGSLVGGVLGALVGSHVGRDSAACNDDGYAYGNRGPAYQGGGQGYRSGGYAYRGRGYGYGGGYVYERRVYQGDGYGYRGQDAYREGYRDGRRDGDQDESQDGAVQLTDQPADRDGCRMAESPVYMPNGEVQKRYVRVCPDGQGHYQIVD